MVTVVFGGYHTSTHSDSSIVGRCLSRCHDEVCSSFSMVDAKSRVRLSPQLSLVLAIVMAGTSMHVSDKQRNKRLSWAHIKTKCKTDRTITGKKTFNPWMEQPASAMCGLNGDGFTLRCRDINGQRREGSLY